MVMQQMASIYKYKFITETRNWEDLTLNEEKEKKQAFVLAKVGNFSWSVIKRSSNLPQI